MLNTIRAIGIWFRVLINELANNTISVILIIILYMMLWNFPQTIDLLLVLNQNNAHSLIEVFTLEVPLYFTLLVVISFFIWNAPKYYFQENYNFVKFKNIIGFVPTNHYKNIAYNNRYAYNCKYHIRKVLPRVLGCLVMFISAFAILNAMEESQISSVFLRIINPNVALLMVVLFFVLLLEFHIYNKIKNYLLSLKKVRVYISTFIVVLFITILFLGFINNQSQEDLKYLFSANFALALIFFALAFNTQRLLSEKFKPIFYGSIIASGLLVIIIYVVFNFNPNLSRHLNPLSVLLICLLALYTISFLLVFGGKKIRFPLFTFIVLLGFLLGEFNSSRSGFDHYVLEETTSTNYERLPLEDYIYFWIVNRKEKILEAEDGTYPVLFISAEGGGSRAGLWSFLIHSYLSEKSNNKYYEDYLFSLTGASGGNVGNAMFFATAQNAILKNKKVDYKSNNNEYNYKASEIYKENYLSTSILGLLGRDLFNNVIGFLNFDNRGELLQNEWQNTYNSVFNNKDSILDRDIFSYYKSIDTTKFVPPLLFLNSSHAQKGMYSVISPTNNTAHESFSGYFDLIKELQHEKDDNASVKLNEAMRINAAFPFITPVGEIKGLGVFGDAGYYDNVGGTVTLSLFKVFNKVLQDHKDEFALLIPKLDLKKVLIYANIENESALNHEKKISQMEAPLQIILNVRSGHTKEQIQKVNDVELALVKTSIDTDFANNSNLRKSLSTSLKGIDSAKVNVIEPVLPLGRYLSGTAIKAIENCLKSNDIKSKLNHLILN